MVLSLASLKRRSRENPRPKWLFEVDLELNCLFNKLETKVSKDKELFKKSKYNSYLERVNGESNSALFKDGINGTEADCMIELSPWRSNRSGDESLLFSVTASEFKHNEWLLFSSSVAFVETTLISLGIEYSRLVVLIGGELELGITCLDRYFCACDRICVNDLDGNYRGMRISQIFTNSWIFFQFFPYCCKALTNVLCSYSSHFPID